MWIEGGREGNAEPGRRGRAHSLRLVVAGLGVLLAGLAIAWADTRPGWDDTGITAGSLVLCGALGTSLGLRPWLSAALTVVPLLAAELPDGTAVLVSIPLAALGALAGGLVCTSLVTSSRRTDGA